MQLDFSSLINSFQSFLLLKLGLLLVMGIYTVFAFVVLVQVRTMNKIIYSGVASTIVLSIAIGQIVFSLLLFLLTLAIL